MNPNPQRKETTRQIRGSSLLLLGRVIALGLNLFVQVLIVRALSKAGFGVFAYALSIVAIGEGVVTLGLQRVLVRHVPIFEEEGNAARVLGTIQLAFGLCLAAGLAMFLAVIAGRDILTASLEPNELAVPVLVTLFALAPIQGIDRLLMGLFSAFERTRVIFVRRFLVTPGLRLVAVAVTLGLGGDARVLAFCYLGAGIVGTAAFGRKLYAILRDNGILDRRVLRESNVPARELLSFALPLLTTELVFLGINQTDAVMLGTLSGAAAVASIRAISPVARLNQALFEMFGVLFTPLASRLYQREDWQGLNELYWRTTIWIAVLSFPLFAVTFSLARPLTTTLFGERYAESASLLALLSCGYYLHAALGPNGMLLNVFKRVRYTVVINVIAFAVNVVGNFILIPRWGPLGAAIATVGTLVIHNLLKQVGMRAEPRIRAFDPSYVGVYLRLGVGAALLVIVEVAGHPSWWMAGAVAIVVSAAMMRLNRAALDLEGTFPEIARVPGARFLVRSDAR